MLSVKQKIRTARPAFEVPIKTGHIKVSKQQINEDFKCLYEEFVIHYLKMLALKSAMCHDQMLIARVFLPFLQNCKFYTHFLLQKKHKKNMFQGKISFRRLHKTITHRKLHKRLHFFFCVIFLCNSFFPDQCLSITQNDYHSQCDCIGPGLHE